MKLLIAEDDLVSRTMLQAIATKLGFDAVAVADGIAAWEQLKNPAGPRLVLLDWIMPGMDGVEVCRRVRKTEFPDPHFIIMLTARGDKQDVVAGLRAGANDYIAKPFDIEELKARLEVGKRVVELQGALADRVNELKEALSQVKTLQGLLPICSYCHKIRADQEVWERIEHYITQRSDAKFTHGICPECLKKQLADLK